MRSAFAVGNTSVDTFRALNYSPFLECFRQPRDRKKSTRLGEMVSAVGPAYGTVFTRIDCHPSQGVELISQSDMFSAEPAGRVVRSDSMTRPERHQVQRWQVLIAGAGTLGETELYGRSIIAGRAAGREVRRPRCPRPHILGAGICRESVCLRIFVRRYWDVFDAFDQLRDETTSFLDKRSSQALHSGCRTSSQAEDCKVDSHCGPGTREVSPRDPSWSPDH